MANIHFFWLDILLDFVPTANILDFSKLFDMLMLYTKSKKCRLRITTFCFLNKFESKKIALTTGQFPISGLN